MMKTAAVKQTKDQIADMIRGDIISGSIKSGAELTQEYVAARTGLSRMPVREAFQTLEQEGFLIRLPNRHMRVVEITHENIKQYFETLVTLESLFLKQNFGSNQAMKDIKSALNHATDENTLENEMRVHLSISSALQNKYLEEIHSKLLDSFYFYALQRYWKKDIAIKSLKEILEAIKKQQETEVSSALNNYFAFYEKTLTKGRYQ